MAKKLTKLFVIMTLLVSILPVSITLAEEIVEPTITVDSLSVTPGEEFDVSINIENNPGILGAKLTFSFSEELTLKNAKKGSAFNVLSMTKPGKLESPCGFAFDGEELEEDDIKDGEILILTFVVDESAESGKELFVNLSHTTKGVIDYNLNPVTTTIVNGKISVIDFIPGDLNDDKEIDISDVILLRRYIAGGYDIEINELAADVNADGSSDITDVILLRRYIAGGYGVELMPGKKPFSDHDHNLIKTEAKNATCTEDGNITYWYCAECSKYYSDSEGKTEITKESTIIKGGHHFVDGVCSECGETEENCYYITYDIENGDSYLEKVAINNTNSKSYSSSVGYTLKNISTPGYRFLGWYDGAGSNAEQIKKIPAGTSGDIELIAHWEKIVYKVQLKSDLFIDKSELEYTIDTGVALPTPKLSNYVFVGWTDEDGSLYKNTKIPVGTTGNIYLDANWTSERNKTYTKTELEDPIIYEDGENNKIYFAYEIGEVQNVPIYEIHNFGYINENGVKKTVTETFQVEYSEDMMEQYANAISKATVQSSDWTLSDGWTQNTYVDQQWASENGKSYTETQEYCKRNTSEWSVSSGTSGSQEIVETSSLQNELKSEVKIGKTTTDSSKVTDQVKESTKDTASLKTTLDVGVSNKASIENESTVGANFGVKIPSVGDVGASASNRTKTGLETTVSTNLSVEASDTREVYNESSHTTEKGHETKKEKENTISGGKTNTTSNSATTTLGWNNSSSYGGSSEESQSQSTTNELTEKITEAMNIGESIGKEVKETNSKGLSSSDSSTNEYSSSVAYTTSKSEERTETWTTSNTKSGYHRWVVAGTAHVFAIVTYDMASQSYSVFTYSIMDDETHEFEDYSYTTAMFDDNENGVISFKIPEYVNTYVANRCFATRGLKVDMSTGVVTDYQRDNYDGTFTEGQPGEYSVVVIPEYYNVGDGDVVKITGISSNAFKNNKNIKSVILSDFIEEIPDDAFSNCTSLIGIGSESQQNSDGTYRGSMINKIGLNAFSGCTSFEGARIPSGITSIGNNAFDGINNLYIDVANPDVMVAAYNSGAKNITINFDSVKEDTSEFNNKCYIVPSNVDKLILNGNNSILNNVTFDIKCNNVSLNKMTFNAEGIIPLKIASPNVTLNQVTVNATGLGLVLSGKDDGSTSIINLGLQGTNGVYSSGTYSLLSKSLNLYEINPKTVGKLDIGSNTARVYDRIDNISKFNGLLEIIDETTFNNMLRSYTLSFNPNGGECSITSIEVANSEKIGTLPVPTRDNYDFVGWFTELEGGLEVTSETSFSDGKDITIYARWQPKKYSLILDANNGVCDIDSIDVYFDMEIGELPTPTRDYYSFVGWYTEQENGEEITSNTIFKESNDITVYAIWQENDISSEFILEKDLPEDTRIVEEKWTYDLRTNIESENQSEDGYVLYDSYWVEKSRNSFNYASFPSGFDTNNWIYTSFHKSCDVSEYETENSKRTLKDSWAGYVYWKWDYNANYANRTDRTISPVYLLSGTNGYAYKYFHANLSSTNHPYLDNMYCNSYNLPSYNCSSEFNYTDVAGPTPRFFRFDYRSVTYIDYKKIYKHYKTEEIESSSIVIENDSISNVQHWVKYQCK